MDLRPSEQQRILQAAIDELLGRECSLTMVRDCDEGRASWEQIWDVVRRQGYFDLALSAEGGGAGGSLADVAVFLHRAGYFAVPGPLVDTISAALMVDRTPAGKRASAPGEAVRARVIAWSEPGADQLEHFQTQLADDLRLTGRKTGVYGAAAVSEVVAFVRQADGRPAVVLVGVASPAPVKRVMRPSVGGEHLHDMDFESVQISPDAVLSTEMAGVLAKAVEG